MGHKPERFTEEEILETLANGGVQNIVQVGPGASATLQLPLGGCSGGLPCGCSRRGDSQSALSFAKSLDRSLGMTGKDDDDNKDKDKK